MRFRSFVFLLLLSLVPAPAAVKHSEAKELQAVARAYGFPAVVTDAAATCIDTGDSKPLRRLLRQDDLMVVVGAAGMLFEMEEDFAPEVVERLKRGEGTAEVQIASLAFATDRGTVQYLVGRLEKEEDAKVQGVVTTALRVITGKDLSSAEEWRAWWRKQPRKYRPKSRTTEEVMSKLALAQSANARDTFQAAVKKMATGKGGEALDKVAVLLGSLADLQEEGRNLKLSRPAAEGDASFASGDFAAAAAAYERAISKRRNDHRSAFMRGCALFELGKPGEAKTIFERLHHEDERRKASRFMADLCAKEIANVDRVFENAMAVLHAMGEPEDLMTWGDPVLREIVSQKLALVRGPESVDIEKVMERFGTEQDPVALLGLALCHPPQMQDQLIKVLVQRFPDQPVILSQYLRRQFSGRTVENRSAYLPKIQAWVAAEPDNALPRLLEIATFVEVSMLPSEQAPQPPDEVLAKLEAALQLPRYETGVVQAARSQLGALRSLECASAPRVSVSGSQKGINHLLSYLGIAADGASLRREGALLDRISDIYAAIASRESAVALASMDQVLAFAQTRMARSAQRKYLRLYRANDPRLLDFEGEEKASAEELKRKANGPKDVMLEILPLPSLQRARFLRTYQILER